MSAVNTTSARGFRCCRIGDEDRSSCTCSCYGCKFDCGAHWSWRHRIDTKLRPWRYWWNTETRRRGIRFIDWLRR